MIDLDEWERLAHEAAAEVEEGGQWKGPKQFALVNFMTLDVVFEAIERLRK